MKENPGTVAFELGRHAFELSAGIPVEREPMELRELRGLLHSRPVRPDGIELGWLDGVERNELSSLAADQLVVFAR